MMWTEGFGNILHATSKMVGSQFLEAIDSLVVTISLTHSLTFLVKYSLLNIN